MRWEPAEHERHALARRDRELRHGRETVSVHVDWRVKREGVGAADRQAGSIRPANPGHDPTIVEADDQLHPHRDYTRHALHESKDVRDGLPRWHTVHEAHRAGVGDELRLEDERSVAVPSPGL